MKSQSSHRNTVFKTYRYGIDKASTIMNSRLKIDSTLIENVDSAFNNKLKVAAAFDLVAPIYDESFNSSPVIQRLRSKVYKEIELRIKAGASILDVNCGTGVDTVYFAGKGMKVTGIDLSPKMIEQCRNKKKALQLNNVEFHVSSFETLSQKLKPEFDLVLSNFGGLNCVPKLDRVAEEINSLIRTEGYFVAVVMPCFSLWEIVTGIISGKWGYAFRRFHSHVHATGFNDESFEVFYHSLHRFVSSFRPWFTAERIIGFNIVSPPPSSIRFLQRHSRFSSFLIQLDEFIERIPLVRAMGDHYMIVMKRKPV